MTLGSIFLTVQRENIWVKNKGKYRDHNHIVQDRTTLVTENAGYMLIFKL